MKTREQILENSYMMLDFVFPNKTPKETAKKLIELINARTRVVLDYGDIQTKVSWGEVYDVSGYISYSKGSYGFKYPILVYSSRSSGGGLILTDCILSIKASRGKQLLFEL